MLRKLKNDLTNETGTIIEETMQALLRILYMRECETEAHILNVAELTLSLARKVGIPETENETIRIGAMLHDLGKIVIPDRILFKMGKFTDEEWAYLQKHPEFAFDLMSKISYFQQAVDIPYCHHEHWNGTGYPRGLSGEEIPLAARIFSIVDIWDSLASDRPYRTAWKVEDIKFFLKEQAGVTLDPRLVPLFLEGQSIFPHR